MAQVPKFDELMWPTIKALRHLGGSGSNAEILETVISLEKIPEEIQAVLHNDGPRSELEYRLAWTRSYLKDFGALTNSERGIWALTDQGRQAKQEDMANVVPKNREMRAAGKKETRAAPQTETVASVDDGDWKTKLLKTLQSISPAAFERLAQRLLREAGFVEVEVTGKSGDGGIDGHGVLRVGLISFKVLFQCKRYKGSVAADAIRDFRGAMQGRADKGLFITTGSFSAPARKEARRDGALTVDLIDGDVLCDQLKRLKLGISVNESIETDDRWFARI